MSLKNTIFLGKKITSGATNGLKNRKSFFIDHINTNMFTQEKNHTCDPQGE